MSTRFQRHRVVFYAISLVFQNDIAMNTSILIAAPRENNGENIAKLFGAKTSINSNDKALP